MPTCENGPGGPPVWVERGPYEDETQQAPRPHNPRVGLREAARLNRLELYCGWYFLRHERGVSVADIGRVFHKPPDTIKTGLRVARRHLQALGLVEGSDHVPHLTPIFGCRPLTPDRPKSCPVCRDHIDSDSLVCGKCDRASDRNERKLAVQRVKADADERRTTANWAATAPKPAPRAKPAPTAIPLMATA